LSPGMVDAPEELCASIFRIEVRKLRCCARDVDGGVTVAGACMRRDGGVAMVVRAGRQEPRKLNLTGGIQQEKRAIVSYGGARLRGYWMLSVHSSGSPA
jgi:hypothetical protein